MRSDSASRRPKTAFRGIGRAERRQERGGRRMRETHHSDSVNAPSGVVQIV